MISISLEPGSCRRVSLLVHETMSESVQYELNESGR